MCVACYLAPGTEFSVDEVTKMHRNNADGVGIAWAQGGMVHWWKTLKVDPDYVTRAINVWKDVPRLVHFRFATAGGARVELCHPFEVGPQANYRPTGSTGGQVMIHNGHWGRWDEVMTILKREALLPDGPWSDSRLAAYLASDSPEWLQALAGSHGKVAVMNGEGKVLRIGDWKKLRDGVFVSNDHWQTATTMRGGYQGYRTWPGWNMTEEEYKALWEAGEVSALEEMEREVDAQVRTEMTKAVKEAAGTSEATKSPAPGENPGTALASHSQPTLQMGTRSGRTL